MKAVKTRICSLGAPVPEEVRVERCRKVLDGLGLHELAHERGFEGPGRQHLLFPGGIAHQLAFDHGEGGSATAPSRSHIQPLLHCAHTDLTVVVNIRPVRRRSAPSVYETMRACSVRASTGKPSAIHRGKTCSLVVGFRRRVRTIAPYLDSKGSRGTRAIGLRYPSWMPQGQSWQSQQAGRQRRHILLGQRE